ncbi:MAG: serine hydrolase [Gammaproteobacteria bacterium]
MHKSGLILLLGLFAAFGSAARAAPAAPLAGLDSYVHKIIVDWQVPGLAVAVVKDNHVVFMRGYGVRELGKPGKVDDNTLFTIASNTKAFTAAALGTLVAQDKLGWNDRITKYLPRFEVNDPWVTHALTIRDLLTHDSGYCDPIFMWFTTGFTRAQIIEHLRYAKPTYGFRAHFCYNNAMYLVASQVIPAITGQSWEDYVQAHLFAPLAMSHTDTRIEVMDANPDAAAPHALVDGKISVVRRYDTDAMAPIGGINSSVNDMSHWLLMLLDNGQYQGQTVLDPKVIAAMETPQVVIPADRGIGSWLHAMSPGSDFFTYGLGLIVEDYHGQKVVMHDGDIDGMASALGMIPALHLGVVVLTNLDHDDARNALLYHIFDRYLGLPAQGVESRLLGLAAKQRAAEKSARAKLAAARVPGPAPLPLADYTGNYHNDLDGSVQVQLENGHLALKVGNPNLDGELVHWNHNTFRVQMPYRFYEQTFDQYVTFDLDAAGQPMELRFFGFPARFVRNAAPAGDGAR